jgi:putative transposase
MGSSRRVSAGHGISTVVLDRGVLYKYDMSSYTIHYKSNNNVVYSCKYHVVWCPKYRRSVLVNGVDTRLKAIIQDVCIACRAKLLKLEVMPNHVHLLVEVDPHYGIHRLVRAIKGRSSRLLRQEYPWLKSRLPTLWTNSYFVSTVGGAPVEVIKQYIEHQKRV